MEILSDIQYNVTNSTTTSNMDDMPWDSFFVVIHATVNIVLAAVGLLTILTLLAKNSRRYYIEQRLRGIGAVEGQILMASLLFCSIYLPCMAVSFLGIDFTHDRLVCPILIWFYGTIHAAMLAMHACLAVCWLVKVLWPMINMRTHLMSLYITLVVLWLVPALVFAVHTSFETERYSLPSKTFCMNDLDMSVYLPGFAAPMSVITIFCYSVCFVGTREWKRLQYEVSPRIVGIVIMPARDYDAMNSHCTAYFLFASMYLAWRMVFVHYPAGDFYTPIILHTSMIMTPLMSVLTSQDCYDCFIAPITKCVTSMCQRKPETVAGGPPSYADIMAEQTHETQLGNEPSRSRRLPIPEIFIETVNSTVEYSDETVNSAAEYSDETVNSAAEYTDETVNSTVEYSDGTVNFTVAGELPSTHCNQETANGQIECNQNPECLEQASPADYAEIDEHVPHLTENSESLQPESASADRIMIHWHTSTD